MEIDQLYEVDWGASDSRWTGKQVQDFIKGQLKAIIHNLNKIDKNTSSIRVDVILNPLVEAFDGMNYTFDNETEYTPTDEDIIVAIPVDWSFYGNDRPEATGIYIFSSDEEKFYAHWDGEEEFHSEGKLYKPGVMYYSDNDLAFGSSLGIVYIGTQSGLLGEIRTLENRLTEMESSVKTFNNFINQFSTYMSSTLTPAMNKLKQYPDIVPTDAVTYGIKGGKFEAICPDGYDILVQASASTMELSPEDAPQIALPGSDNQQEKEGGEE